MVTYLPPSQKPPLFKVLSPPCGMVTFLEKFTEGFGLFGSKPTVWDGDPLRSFPHTTRKTVLSPPCGMVTGAGQIRKLVLKFVLSPPCGMVTYSKPPKNKRVYRSKPTVWDGDALCGNAGHRCKQNRSKPTVWDGDQVFYYVVV